VRFSGFAGAFDFAGVFDLTTTYPN
jgi:hypothetical protein